MPSVGDGKIYVWGDDEELLTKLGPELRRAFYSTGRQGGCSDRWRPDSCWQIDESKKRRRILSPFQLRSRRGQRRVLVS